MSREIEEPKSFYFAFEQACQSLTTSTFYNRSVYDLGREDQAVQDVRTVLSKVGCNRFINLSRSVAQSQVAFATKTDNGLVAKVTSANYGMDSGVGLYEIPPVFEELVRGRDVKFKVQVFPWIKGETYQLDIEDMRTKMNQFGVDLIKGDDRPDNFRKMVDADRTVVAIDHTFSKREDVSIPDGLVEKWDSHVRKVYEPAYDMVHLTTKRPEPLSAREFMLYSAHRDDAHLLSFDHNRTSEMVTVDERDLGKSIEPKQSFMDKIYHFIFSPE